jgi:hypothetical protein
MAITRRQSKKLGRQLCVAFAALLMIAFAPSSARSQAPSASEYFEGCQIAAGLGATGDAGALSVRQQLSVSLCLGFVDGANSALAAFSLGANEEAGAEPLICADQAPSNYDALTVWVGYLQDYPIQLTEEAFTTFLRAMQEAFPCP